MLCHEENKYTQFLVSKAKHAAKMNYKKKCEKIYILYKCIHI